LNFFLSSSPTTTDYRIEYSDVNWVSDVSKPSSIDVGDKPWSDRRRGSGIRRFPSSCGVLWDADDATTWNGGMNDE
jgi:hypothetical protein